MFNHVVKSNRKILEDHLVTSKKIIIVSELYYPEDNATGFLLTRIAEGLARWFPVHVVCGQPNYFARGAKTYWKEARHGVNIRRCWSTTFNKNNIFLRLINGITISFSIMVNLFVQCREGDIFIVVTNPPLLPFVAYFVSIVKKTKCVLLIHDVYPDVLIVTGVLNEHSAVSRVLSFWTTVLYKGVDKIIVLGRDMCNVVMKKAPHMESKIVTISNWADTDSVRPLPRYENILLKEWELDKSFVALYVGNMGRTHGLELLLECAEELKNTNIRFLFIGDGVKKKWAEEYKLRKNLHNVIILSPRPRAEQHVSLNACDVAVITFVKNMAGISVPSRMYNIMAAGKPIIAVADEQSELAKVVREEQIGLVVEPGNSAALKEAIINLADNKRNVEEMGKRAWTAANSKYSFELAIERYKNVLEELLTE